MDTNKLEEIAREELTRLSARVKEAGGDPSEVPIAAFLMLRASQAAVTCMMVEGVVVEKLLVMGSTEGGKPN